MQLNIILKTLYSSILLQIYITHIFFLLKLIAILLVSCKWGT